jgi:hypothetical protein
MNAGNQFGAHLRDLAELAALGALEPSEQAQVEAHVVACAACAQLLGDAQSRVAALEDAFTPQMEPPANLGARLRASAARSTASASASIYGARDVKPAHGAGTTLPVERVRRRIPQWYATAAALLLAAGIGSGALLEHTTDMRQAAGDSAILATIAASHFNHVTFTPRDAAAPVTKVLFARDGAWFYVIIDSAACNCRVITRNASGSNDLGAPAVRGSTATLFVRDTPRPSSIALVAPDGRILSEATLAYSVR